MDFDELEAKYIANGKAYGYDGEKLREYVEKRLAEAMDRLKRLEARTKDRATAELEEKIQGLEQKLQAATVVEAEVEGVSATPLETQESGSRKSVIIKVPKYDGKESIVSYLELFEDVAEQNKFERAEWLIRLRVALTGTRYEGSCRGCRSYEDARRELLAACGLTAEKAWKQLTTITQSKDETFYQFVIRVCRAVFLWSKRTVLDGGEEEEETLSIDSNATEDMDKMQQALVKQIAIEASAAELKAFLLERKCFEMSLREFQAAGMSYQDAHGVRHKQHQESTKKAERTKHHQQQQQHSTQSFGISVAEVVNEMEKMPSGERKPFVYAKRLCLNCLKFGHRAGNCRSRAQCSKCNGRHHTLLHPEPETVKTNGIKAYGCALSASVHLMTGVAEVGGSKRAKVRVFIDPGSQASFISPALVAAIQPKTVGTDRVTVTAFASEPVPQDLKRYEVTVTGTSRPIKIRAWEKPDMSMSLPVVAPAVVEQWQSRGLELSDRPTEGTPKDVHLLIGADHSNEILVEKKTVDGEAAWKTEIGWVLSGPNQGGDAASPVKVSCIETKIERLWQMEEPPSVASSGPEFPIERTGTQYQVGLLWRSERRPPDNFGQATAAATKLLQRLNSNGKRRAYDEVLIKEYVELGAIEKEKRPEEPGYYMPHHAVFRESAATTKTRVVFNASASARGKPSLNDLMDPGPSLLPDLVGLLLRFREYRYALQADIKKAFFMVGIREEDRPYVRFVWPEEGEDEMCIWRLTKLPFGVNCSPYILNAVLLYHLDRLTACASNDDERAVLLLLKESFYVDDAVTSVPCAARAAHFKELSVSALREAGMELRKWRGNGIECDPESGGKVLGVDWQADDDCIAVAAIGDVDDDRSADAEAEGKFRWTRRYLLHCVASAFDPMGLAAPAVLPGKILLQACWKLGGSWDHPLPSEIASQCAKWWGELSELPLVKVPRWIGCEPGAEVSLHVFADASEKAYGCCIYLVSNGVSCLLFGKSKVAPVAAQTLARLELQAVCLASRSVKFVVTELRVSVSSVYGWTDSMTTMQWISGPSYKWKTYVANRVARVQQTAREVGIKWNHCPGKMNPADIASRGSTVEGLTNSEWLQGPAWLTDQAAWPAERPSEETSESAVEQRVNAVSVEPEQRWWERLSKWSRVLGVIIRMFQWRHSAKSRAELRPLAEAALHRIVQRDLFATEIAAVQAGEAVSAGSKTAKLSPYLDEHGVLRASGRLDQSELPYVTKHPVILGQHYVTTLLMEHAHAQQMHGGVESVLAALRQEVWIFGARRALRAITSRCVVCKRFKAPTATEVSPPLPQDRVVHKKPFGLTGIDYAGPLMVQDGDQVRKKWVALFVCGTTRAVHLETVDSLSTDAFLLAYRRFVARRGTPCRIRSDNATTFKAAAERIGVTWLFNPPAAPWHGGFFERLVGAVKSPLRKVLGRALLGPRELDTVLAEVEAVVNSRPLTHVADTADELPLTPAMMVSGVWHPEEATDKEASTTPAQLNSRQRYVQEVGLHLKKRWNQEYLTALIAYHQSKSASVKAGDVVLLVDDTRKRQSWRLALVVQVYPGKDGAVRVVRAKVGQTTMLRPVQRLVPLEVSSMPDESVESVDDPPESGSSAASEATPSLPEVSTTDQQSSPIVRVSRGGRPIRARSRLDL